MVVDFCVIYLNGYRDFEFFYGNRGYVRFNFVFRIGRNEIKGMMFCKVENREK